MKNSPKHTPEFRRWYKELLQLKRYYSLFTGVQFDIDMLVEYYKLGKTPTDTLNDLSTVT